uniref:Uncharacterized protein n=1 Tax=Tetradesmus obliquus TaxID=3088 RepID=A0A383WCT7_TETOB
MDEAAKARAEAAAARRAKILARQKDRITSITGAYSGQSEQEQQEQRSSSSQLQPPASGDVAAAAPAPAASGSAAPAAGAPLQPTSTQDQQQQQQQLEDEQQQQMAAIMAAMSESLQRAQAVTQADPHSSAAPAPQQQQAQALLAHLLGGQAAAGAHSSAPQQSPLGSEHEQPQHEQPAVMQPVAVLLQLGPSLSVAVKQSQAMRLLSALLIAYAALSGWQMGLSPAVLLVVTNLSVVAAALMLLHTSAAGRKLLAGQQQGGSGEDGQVPMSLRSFDFLSLVPGLRQLLTALAGYKHLANAMSEDFAVYVVGLGMLTAMLSLQPPLVKV